MTDNYLFITEVGSRMWGMENFASDYDLFHVFQQPSSDYLRKGIFKQTRAAKTYMQDGKEIDAQYWEIGHLIHQLKKGNVNAIWGVCSGVVWKNSNELKTLRDIVIANISKESYHSIRGMAMSQFSDATKRAAVRDPEKSLWTCTRTLNFGCNLLFAGYVGFEKPTTSAIDEEFCKEEFKILDECYKLSTLPDHVNPKPFEDFLWNIRMSEILDNFTVKLK